jgi:hypothetical protein
MRKFAQVFTENIGSLFSLWYQSNKIFNKFDLKKKMATTSLPEYPSYLNLANFVSLKLTSTNYLLWETHEPYHLMKVRLLVRLQPSLMHSRPNLAFGYNPRQVCRGVIEHIRS